MSSNSEAPSPLPTSEIYHEATKYTLEGIRVRAVPIQMENRPTPHKQYQDAETLDLDLDDLEQGLIPNPTAQSLSTAEISKLLGFTYGVTARVGPPPDTVFLRAAPSAGGLYPTELYLCLGAGHGYKAGVYNYQSTTHSLVRVIDRDETENVLSALPGQDALKGTNAFAILTGIFERSAWRYEDRAYRRMLLDAGHVLGNLLLITEKMGRNAYPIAGFNDQTLAHTLLLDHHVEAGFIVVPIRPGNSPLTGFDISKRCLTASDTEVRPNTSIMRHLHKVSSITDLAAAETATKANLEAEPETVTDQINSSPETETPAVEALPETAAVLEGRLEDVIVRRRSARQFAGLEISRADLGAILKFGAAAPWRLTESLVETYVVVHSVENLSPGVYRYQPEDHQLLQVSQSDCRDEVRNVVLGQELGSESAAVVFHVAPLDIARQQFGDRAYRYLHLDCGYVGQRLNLLAVSRDLGASGIAGFFDNDVNELLGLSANYGILYLTTIGIPEAVEDDIA